MDNMELKNFIQKTMENLSDFVSNGREISFTIPIGYDPMGRIVVREGGCLLHFSTYYRKDCKY